MTTEQFEFGGDIVWQPNAETIARANLTRFMHDYGAQDYADLIARSAADPAGFTEAVLRFLNIEFYQPYHQVLDTSAGPAWPKWCVGGYLNIAHNCLDRYIGTPTEDRIALKWEGETGEMRNYTYGELHRAVNRAANALRSLGLTKGDTIGIFMPMVPEIAIALLAIAKIGAISLPLFSGYGVSAIANRLQDAEAKCLITADGLARRGQSVLMKPTADEAAALVPSLKHLIVYNHLALDIPMQPGRDHEWRVLLDAQPDTAPTEPTLAEDPLMILYTSGTTGRPKGALHTHCGFPIKAAQDMAFGTDIHPGDTIYWMTDMGWMMGPWLVFGALLLGATFVLYDGAPDYPGPDRLWQLVERHRVNALGVSPTLVRALVPHGTAPLQGRDIASLRCFASTGEPWNPDPWLWLFNTVGQGKLPIINYSGGTEISGGIVMGNPILPLKPAAFSGVCPGIAADILDESGNSVSNQVGELVIKGPWIGMTRGFWKDPQRYEETYWRRWPGIWLHGDWAARDSDGMWYILGRSDDTIKIAGKRLGPAEVESVLVAHPDVVEAAAVGVPHPIKGNELIAFCVLRPGCKPDAPLRQTLHNNLVTALGKPLAPKAIHFVKDIPKTRNAKVMRRIVKAAYLGQDPGDTSSLVNPESLQAIAAAALETS